MPAWPDLMRRSQASTCGIEFTEGGWDFPRRLVAELVAAGAAVRVDDALIHAPCVSIAGEMPFPSGPVPGKWSGGGTWSRENQYWAG